MPKLPVVKSRQSRVSGRPSQVAGALIPDNTQHSWRDDVGKKVLKVLASRGVWSWHWWAGEMDVILATVGS
jgi:hypothetical protein